MSNYRQRIYERYASRFMGEPREFDAAYAERWGRAYDYYLRGWLPPDKQAAIVDLGCGGGRLLYFFKRRGYVNLAGVDVSPEQVALAKQVVPGVIEGDALLFLEAHPGRFELITALDLLEHFYKDEVMRFLDGCWAALQPGGRLVLQTINANTPWGSLHRYYDFTHEMSFTPNSLRRLLALCGFEKLETREQGPAPYGHSWKSSVRHVLWQAFRLGLKAWNKIELGHDGGSVFTRNLLISGRKS